MKFQRRRIAVATACALGSVGLGSGGFAGISFAQDIRVDVTGSNIKRVDTEGPAPVAIITREDIERRGATTVSELLRSLPSQGGFTFDDQFTNGFAPGTSGVGLRNLGQNATLILVNGRRVANYGFAQNIDLAFVDINSIPVGAIERIEVLKDGASAIYGSDAIAGVINFILRKDFKGVEAAASYGVTEDGDGDETRASVVAGFGELAKDRYNAMVVVDYYKREPIYYGDRDYSRNADMTSRGGFDLRSPTGSPGTYVSRAGTSPGFSADCRSRTARPRASATAQQAEPMRVQLQPVHHRHSRERAQGCLRALCVGHHAERPAVRRRKLQQQRFEGVRSAHARRVRAAGRSQQQSVSGAVTINYRFLDEARA